MTFFLRLNLICADLDTSEGGIILKDGNNDRKIVWDGKNIRLPRKFDEAYIESVFKENGWYGEDSKTTSSIDTTTGENKYIKKKKDKKKEDVVKKSKNVSIIDELKELKQLFDDGVITEREFK